MYKTTNDGLGIISPRVIGAANSYFNCPNTDNVALENGGGKGTAGSHWDRSALGDETMTGAVMSD